MHTISKVIEFRANTFGYKQTQTCTQNQNDHRTTSVQNRIAATVSVGFYSFGVSDSQSTIKHSLNINIIIKKETVQSSIFRKWTKIQATATNHVFGAALCSSSSPHHLDDASSLRSNGRHTHRRHLRGHHLFITNIHSVGSHFVRLDLDRNVRGRNISDSFSCIRVKMDVRFPPFPEHRGHDHSHNEHSPGSCSDDGDGRGQIGRLVAAGSCLLCSQ